MRELLDTHEVFEIPDTSNCVLSDNELVTLVTYYRDKRLIEQKDYFYEKARLSRKIDTHIHKLPHWLFFSSVSAVFIHFVFDVFSSHDIHTLSIISIVLAASLPVIGTGIRTMRSAHEFARRASLFRAKYTALQRIDDVIQGIVKEPATAKNRTEKILHNLWQCEQFLEDEHYEWLRLMYDTEWFG